MLLFDLINLVYPRACLSCGDLLHKSENFLCLLCLTSLPKTNFHLEEDNHVTRKFSGKTKIENASAYYFYTKDSLVQNLIHKIKYKGFINASYEIGKNYGRELLTKENYRSVDIIIPVPLHKKKQRKRGYNQSEYFARGLGYSMDKEVNNNILFRVLETETQTKKKIYERWLNVRSIFMIKNSYIIEGKHILLVDDVITSGSTICSCAEALLTVPGVTVSVVGIATV